MSRLPRDPQQIAKDFDTAAKLREIREWETLKDALSVRFADVIIIAGLFSFSIALILTLIFVLPQKDEGLYEILLLWVGGWVLMVVITLEYLVRKLRIIRRVAELHHLRLKRLESEAEGRRRPEQERD